MQRYSKSLPNRGRVAPAQIIALAGCTIRVRLFLRPNKHKRVRTKQLHS